MATKACGSQYAVVAALREPHSCLEILLPLWEWCIVQFQSIIFLLSKRPFSSNNSLGICCHVWSECSDVADSH